MAEPKRTAKLLSTIELIDFAHKAMGELALEYRHAAVPLEFGMKLNAIAVALDQLKDLIGKES